MSRLNVAKTRRREPAGCLIYALRPSPRFASRGTGLVRLVRPDRRCRIWRRLVQSRGGFRPTTALDCYARSCLRSQGTVRRGPRPRCPPCYRRSLRRADCRQSSPPAPAKRSRRFYQGTGSADRSRPSPLCVVTALDAVRGLRMILDILTVLWAAFDPESADTFAGAAPRHALGHHHLES